MLHTERYHCVSRLVSCLQYNNSPLKTKKLMDSTVFSFLGCSQLQWQHFDWTMKYSEKGTCQGSSLGILLMKHECSPLSIKTNKLGENVQAIATGSCRLVRLR